MSAPEDTRVTATGTRRKSVIIVLGLRLVGPYIIYTVLNARLHNELLALGIGAAVPLVAGVATAFKRHRIDPALALSAISLLASLGIAAVIGHGSTIIKLRGAVAPALLGITFLVLAAGPVSLRRPALRALVDMGAKRAARGGRPFPEAVVPERRAAVAAHLRLLMALWGVGLAAIATVHVVIVFSVPTSDYLVASRITSLGLVAVLILCTRILRIHWNRRY